MAIVNDDGWKPLSPADFAARLATDSVASGTHLRVVPPEGFFEEQEEADKQNEEEARVPPHDLDAEGAIISAVLIDPAAAPKIRNLRPSHFYSEAHRRIYEAALEVEMTGRPIDVVTVATYLRDHERLAQVGGMVYLTEVLNAAPAVANVSAYADTVIAKSLQRDLLLSCQLATSQLYTGQDNHLRIADTLRAQIEHVQPREELATTEQILDAWKEHGPLVHEPTGIPMLDSLTGGGPVYGSRWYVLGAPDAGKTALLTQIGDVYARRGICVGFLAVDEEQGDLLMRLAQRVGYSRRDCEIRSATTIDGIRKNIGPLPIRYYNARHTIESAADDLRLFANGKRAALFVDSIQTVSSVASRMNAEMSPRELVTSNVLAARTMATRHDMIVVSTSEMSRGAYRSIESAEKTNDMAAGKESGAIEYSARVMISLRSVKKEPNYVELYVAKNKHGPADVTFHLAIDRARMLLAEADLPVSAAASKPDKKAEKAAAEEEKRSLSERAKDAQLRQDEGVLLGILKARPGIGTHELRAAMAAKLSGCGRARVDNAVARLGEAVRVVVGPKGQRMHHMGSTTVELNEE